MELRAGEDEGDEGALSITFSSTLQAWTCSTPPSACTWSTPGCGERAQVPHLASALLSPPKLLRLHRPVHPEEEEAYLGLGDLDKGRRQLPRQLPRHHQQPGGDGGGPRPHLPLRPGAGGDGAALC